MIAVYYHLQLLCSVVAPDSLWEDWARTGLQADIGTSRERVGAMVKVRAKR